MNPTSTLELRFDADEWNSTISFEAGIPVALDGTLELTFADDVNIMSQVGRTLDLFDWTGVTPTGLFTVASDYTWDLTNLYTTGEVTLTDVTTLPGDVDGDGDVDGRDFLAAARSESRFAHRLAGQLWRQRERDGERLCPCRSRGVWYSRR